MSKLKSATRSKLASSAFGLPKQRKYPMEDRTHQIKAEEFAPKEQRAGKLSPAQASRIRAKASPVAQHMRQEPQRNAQMLTYLPSALTSA
jgi:hypothetical protein